MNRAIIAKLSKLHIITPGGIYHLAKSFVQDGISLMALLRFSAHYYPNRYALVSEGKQLTYKEVYDPPFNSPKYCFRIMV